MNAVARAIGLFHAERGMLRFHWGEISRGNGLALTFKPKAWFHINLWPINLFLNAPGRTDEHPWDGPEYGFSWPWQGGGRTLHLYWGKRSKVVWMPWSWKIVRSEYLAADGSWKAEPRSNRLGIEWEEPTDRWEQEAKYRYCRSNFEVQERVATFRVGRAERRWAMLRWLPWPRWIESAIDVEFSDEVGERTGSWKGGTIGCGYTMRKNETPLECLRRMERERKFR